MDFGLRRAEDRRLGGAGLELCDEVSGLLCFFLSALHTYMVPPQDS